MDDQKKRMNNKLPHSISSYVREHFREDFLFEVKDIRRVKGRLTYSVEVAKDDVIYMLKFNEEGKLLSEETEQAFLSDDREPQASGDVPD